MNHHRGGNLSGNLGGNLISSSSRTSSLHQEPQNVRSNASVSEDAVVTLQKKVHDLEKELETSKFHLTEAKARADYYKQEYRRVDNGYNTIIQSVQWLKLRYKKDMTAIKKLAEASRVQWLKERRLAKPTQEVISISRQVRSLTKELQELLSYVEYAATTTDDINFVDNNSAMTTPNALHAKPATDSPYSSALSPPSLALHEVNIDTIGADTDLHSTDAEFYDADFHDAKSQLTDTSPSTPRLGSTPRESKRLRVPLKVGLSPESSTSKQSDVKETSGSEEQEAQSRSDLNAQLKEIIALASTYDRRTVIEGFHILDSNTATTCAPAPAPLPARMLSQSKGAQL